MIEDTDNIFLDADTLHENGRYREALSLFKQGAEAGDSSCMTRLACMYLSGEGVESDYHKAIEWELKAIELGDITAMVNLGITYRVVGDIKASKHWFEQALMNGDGAGALELAKLYRVSENESDTINKYLNAAISSDNICESDVEEAKLLLSDATPTLKR